MIYEKHNLGDTYPIVNHFITYTKNFEQIYIWSMNELFSNNHSKFKKDISNCFSDFFDLKTIKSIKFLSTTIIYVVFNKKSGRQDEIALYNIVKK